MSPLVCFVSSLSIWRVCVCVSTGLLSFVCVSLFPVWCLPPLFVLDQCVYVRPYSLSRWWWWWWQMRAPVILTRLTLPFDYSFTMAFAAILGSPLTWLNDLDQRKSEQRGNKPSIDERETKRFDFSVSPLMVTDFRSCYTWARLFFSHSFLNK